MKNSVQTERMNAPVDNTEIALVRGDYERAGEDFQFRSVNQGLGYFVEPWSNECFIGPKFAPGQPEPVSCDESAEATVEHEAVIRGWIGETAHPLVVADGVRRAPVGWTLQTHLYDGDWPETEFGASILLFRISL